MGQIGKSTAAIIPTTIRIVKQDELSVVSKGNEANLLFEPSEDKISS